MSAALNLNARQDSAHLRGLTRSGSHLRAVQHAPSARRAMNPLARLLTTVAVGALVIPVLGLLLNLATSTSVYQLLHLQHQQQRLQLQSQILSQQVNSLSSNQNLASAAQAMGMTSNSAPVFLDVASGKVYGTSANQSQYPTGRVSGNLVANSQWTTKTSASQVRNALAAEQAKASKPVVAKLDANDAARAAAAAVATKQAQNKALGYVGSPHTNSGSVSLAGGSIPVAPTH